MSTDIFSALSFTSAYFNNPFSNPVPAWRSDFLTFLRILLQEIELDFVLGTGYYHLNPSEISLASSPLTTEEASNEKYNFLREPDPKIEVFDSV
jgi:hypothetical protein